jgi:hypothetical protein
MNETLKSVKWWKIGTVRVLGICSLVIGVHGVSLNIHNHTLLDFSRLSGPGAIGWTIVGLGFFILGFRTERDHAELSRFPKS